MIRFVGLSVEAFGAVAAPIHVDLDADIVLVLGLNGYGKTTICDAIVWALTGVQPRGAHPANLYSAGRTVTVSLDLWVDGVAWTITRRLAPGGGESLVDVEVSGERNDELSSDAAIARQVLWDRVVDDPREADALTSFYLRQESLREFLQARSDRERFSVLSDFVGSGALARLLSRFESEKAAWTKALNIARKDLGDQESNLAALRLAERSLVDARDEEIRTTGTWARAWLEQVERALRLPGQSVQSVGQGRDVTALALREARQRADELSLALVDLRSPASAGPSALKLSEARDAAEAAAHVLHDRSEALVLLAARREDVLRTARAEQAVDAELSSLAQLALRHLSDHCPTCGQSVRVEELERRLQTLIAGSSVAPSNDELMRIDAEMAEAELSLARARDDDGRAQRALELLLEESRTAAELSARREQRLRNLRQSYRDVEAGSLDSSAQADLDKARGQVAALEELIANSPAEDPAGRLRLMEAQLETVREELSALVQAVASARTAVDASSDVAVRADSLLRALRLDSEEFVALRLAAIDPLVRQLFASVEPHPTFSSVRLVARSAYGKQRLDAVLLDEAFGVEVKDPAATLSTSQANALAVVLYLAFNLGLRPSRIETLLLDDPLQNLDDVHLLGLVDTLRKVAPNRQLIITTHDRDFADLLTRKLRPLTGRRMCRIEIGSWGRSGPEISSRDVGSDEGVRLIS